MDLGVDRGLGCRAGPRRSRCGLVSHETGAGGAHVPGCFRQTLGEFSHAGALGGARPRRSSRGFDSRASRFPEWNLQRVTAAVGYSGQGRCCHGEYLQEVGVRFVDWCAHLYRPKKLAYIFDPEACLSSVVKTTAQRLEQWKAVLGQCDYPIMHIAGDRNCWLDLLSRWATVFRR